MITVYHLKVKGGVHAFKEDDIKDKIMFGELKLVPEAWKANLYLKVATVDSDMLDLAWERTNNTPHLESWSMDENPGVKVEAPLHVVDGRTLGLRSSMVGDVFVLNGVPHVVAMMGFERIDVDVPA